jgi:3-oxoisoapionate decarboxylase
MSANSDMVGGTSQLVYNLIRGMDMRLGLETFSYHLAFAYGKMDIFGFIEKTAQLGLDGVQINVEGDNLAHLGSDDPGFLREVKATTDRLGLFVEIDTCGTNPDNLARVLKICQALGSDTMRVFSSLGGDVQEEIKQAAIDFKQVIPICTDYGIKIAYENHEFESSADIMGVVTELKSDFIGTHIDIGNSMMVWEDPIDAVMAMAPKAVSSHFKDHIVVMLEDQPMIIGVPLGKGSIDLGHCFRILDLYSPLERINIEVCYGYMAPFRIPENEGYGAKLGHGCFKILPPPYDPEVVAPYITQYMEKPFKLQAFGWAELAKIATSETQREELLTMQEKAVIDSVEYVKQLK